MVEDVTGLKHRPTGGFQRILPLSPLYIFPRMLIPMGTNMRGKMGEDDRYPTLRLAAKRTAMSQELPNFSATFLGLGRWQPSMS